MKEGKFLNNCESFGRASKEISLDMGMRDSSQDLSENSSTRTPSDLGINRESSQAFYVA